jgi:chromatin remodeling complex protein RSC6
MAGPSSPVVATVKNERDVRRISNHIKRQQQQPQMKKNKRVVRLDSQLSDIFRL